MAGTLVPLRSVQNNDANSIACEGDSPVLPTPIELLGQGYRWPRLSDNAARAELLARVVAAEIGGGDASTN